MLCGYIHILTYAASMDWRVMDEWSVVHESTDVKCRDSAACASPAIARQGQAGAASSFREVSS